MRPCFHVEITTPRRILLNGLWFGPKKPKRVIVWVHGLGRSLFSKLRIVELLVRRNTAVLVFNNRGHDTVSHLVRTDGKRGAWAGAAHEKFTDCVDDIQGAVNFARQMKMKDIYLAGHSTGCQKSVYWTYKTKGRGMKGIVLLAPVSDYAGALAKHGNAKLARARMAARALVRQGKPRELLPASRWSGAPADPRRFLSLYTPDSAEEIFSYAQPEKRPRILKSVKKPILVLWAEKDEFSDRPASDAAAWFKEHIRAPHRVVIIPGAKHSFRGAERRVAREIEKFIGG